MRMHRSSLLALSLAASVAASTVMPMAASAAHAPPVSVAVSTVSCADDGTASLTLTLTNHLFTETGGPTLFAAEYWADGDPGVLNVWSDRLYDAVGVGSVDVEFNRALDYQLTKGAESDYFVELTTVKNPCVPTERADCQRGGYANYGFDSQRDCFAYLRTGVDRR